MKEVDGHIEETQEEAKQGVNVAWQMRTMIISTAAAAFALIAYFFFFAAP